MHLDIEGYTVRIPSSALSLPSLDWGAAACDHSRDAVEFGREPMGEVIFSASGCALVVIASATPVLRRGVPYAAVVLDGGDARTRKSVGARLHRLLHSAGLYLEGLDLLTGSGVSSPGESLVIVATWECRAALVKAVTMMLTNDPTMQRALLRTAEEDRRRAYDARVVKSFVDHSGGVRGQILGPARRHWRFSDFAVVEKRSLAGVRFVLEFEDFDLLEQAESALRRYTLRVAGTEHIYSVSPVDLISGLTDERTDLIQPRLALFTRWNTAHARKEMSEVLRQICGMGDHDGASSGSTLHSDMPQQLKAA